MPNVRRVEYKCKTCGVQVPPYEFYCERHSEHEGREARRSVLDRFMDRLLGRNVK